MENCKKCGALIGKDFMFCGRCGAPVYETVNNGKIAKVKKLRKLKRFERKLSVKPFLNLVVSGIWFMLSLLWGVLSWGGCKDIRIASAGINDAVGQLIYKYQYVKEGLSLSYISTEFALVADYVCLWAFEIFSFVAAVSGIILFVCYLVNFIRIKKGKRSGSILKICRIVSRIVICSAFVMLGIWILILIMKGVI